MFNIMKVNEFSEILSAQVLLNEKYSGEDWAEIIPKSHFISAMMAELGELLESSPRTGDTGTGWKWWKIFLENDFNNMQVEAVDIIHFAISVLIMNYGSNIEQLLGDYISCHEEFSKAEFDENGENLSSGLMLDINSFSLSSLLDQREESLTAFVYLINSLGWYANMTPEYMYQLYMGKNKLNHERVDGGYTESADAYAKFDENGNEDNTKLFK